MFRFIFIFKLEYPNEKIIISHFLLLFLKPMDGTLQFICYSSNIKCLFGFRLKSQLIILFSLFLLLFMSLIALFDTIHESHYAISTNFYLYLQYFQQKIFHFSKISESQTDSKYIILFLVLSIVLMVEYSMALYLFIHLYCGQMCTILKIMWEICHDL